MGFDTHISFWRLSFPSASSRLRRADVYYCSYCATTATVRTTEGNSIEIHPRHFYCASFTYSYSCSHLKKIAYAARHAFVSLILPVI